MNSELLVVGLISIVAIVVSFIAGIMFAIKLINDTVSRD